MRESFSLTVYAAKEKKTDRYSDYGYGPERFKVEVKHADAPVLTAIVPFERIQDMVTLGFELATISANGIDAARAEYDAAPKDKDGRLSKV